MAALQFLFEWNRIQVNIVQMYNTFYCLIVENKQKLECIKQLLWTRNAQTVLIIELHTKSHANVESVIIVLNTLATREIQTTFVTNIESKYWKKRR